MFAWPRVTFPVRGCDWVRSRRSPCRRSGLAETSAPSTSSPRRSMTWTIRFRGVRRREPLGGPSAIARTSAATSRFGPLTERARTVSPDCVPVRLRRLVPSALIVKMSHDPSYARRPELENCGSSSSPLSCVTFRTGPPCAGTVKRSLGYSPVGALAENASVRPSGDHDGALTLYRVTTFWLPEPSAPTVQIWLANL